jgi:polysaccharide export outer membrane protein
LESERAKTDDEGTPTDIELLAKELFLQATAENPFEIVTIGGKVRAPGIYPFENGMRLSDLLRAGASMAEGAYVKEAELSRFEVFDGTVRRTKVITVFPAAAEAGEPDADILLQPYDAVQIKELQEWRQQLSVALEGEVRFPGRYSFNPGDALISVIERAGGLTSEASPAGSVFLREELKEREEAQIKELTSKIESDLASLALQAARADAELLQAQSAGQALLSKLRNTQATGRLVVDLPSMLKHPDDDRYKVLLKDNDRLLIPDYRQEVTVLGEVQFPTSHLYTDDLNRNDYLNRSGGLTLNAAKKQIYVVRANGSVLSGNQKKWFNNGNKVRIEPGDTIVVPLDTQKVSSLQLWTSATQIIFNLAIAVAAVNSF